MRVLRQAEAGHDAIGERAAFQQLVLRVIEGRIVGLDRLAAVELADRLGTAVDLDGGCGAVDGGRQESVEEAEGEDDDGDAGHQPTVLDDDPQVAQQGVAERIDLLVGRTGLKPGRLRAMRDLALLNRPDGRMARRPSVVGGGCWRSLAHGGSLTSGA
jgi:hypothetical protein